MTERTVDIRLDATICTNEETRSFIKVGISINGIDPTGDVDAQLQESLETGRAGLRVINDGLVEEVSEAITVTDNPARLVDQLGELAERVDKIESLLSKVVVRLRAMIQKALPGALGGNKTEPEPDPEPEPEPEIEITVTESTVEQPEKPKPKKGKKDV